MRRTLFHRLFELFKIVARSPFRSAGLLRSLPLIERGRRTASAWPERNPDASPAAQTPSPGPLREYVDAHKTGRGIWKWNHYFEIYPRFFDKFRNREVHILEVGVHSGGTLEMWRRFFGEKCRVYGVDIEPACRGYQDANTRIFTGDQADPAFWAEVKRQVPRVDILIDDGGHRCEQRIVTFEEMFPFVAPGGVYLCEDIYGPNDSFMAYLYGLARHFHEIENEPRATAFQNDVFSMSFFPYMAVLEKRSALAEPFLAPKRGSEWLTIPG